MKNQFTRIIAAAFLLFGTHSAVSADEPRMEKAVELLQQAKSTPNPVPLLEKAKSHLQNATGNKGGNKVAAIKTINQAIKTAQQGGNARPQISQAVGLVQAGINAR